jgi:hypothetical protein
MRIGHGLVVAVVLLAGAPAAAERALNPGMPALEERYQLTSEWSVTLPGRFNRRLEQDRIVFAQPGFAVALRIWGNERRESRTVRLARLRGAIPAAAFDIEETSDPRALRIGYRLREAAGGVAAFHGIVVGDSGHIEAAMQFDTEAELRAAQQILRSLNETPR